MLRLLAIALPLALSIFFSSYWDVSQAVILRPLQKTDVSTMMVAVYTSETSVYCNETTRRYIPESSNLQSHPLSYYRLYSHPTVISLNNRIIDIAFLNRMAVYCDVE
jgi:hypothetical protein